MRHLSRLTAARACLLAATLMVPASALLADPPADVAFSGPSNSPISAAVAIPAGKAFFFTSGTPPAVADEKAAAGTPERFGDTRTQGLSALRLIEARLEEAGLGFKDVVFLRVYIAADKAKEGKFDYPGWFEAYAQCFGTKENPVKPARSTVGVASLVNPDWLIEIEAVAVYPSATPAAAPKPTP